MTKTPHEIFDGSNFNVIDATAIAEQAAAKERDAISLIITKELDRLAKTKLSEEAPTVLLSINVTLSNILHAIQQRSEGRVE